MGVWAKLPASAGRRRFIAWLWRDGWESDHAFWPDLVFRGWCCWFGRVARYPICQTASDLTTIAVRSLTPDRVRW